MITYALHKKEAALYLQLHLSAYDIYLFFPLQGILIQTVPPLPFLSSLVMLPTLMARYLAFFLKTHIQCQLSN